AFSQMQRSMKKRLNELSLLLSVSHDVSTNIDLNQGMPAILRGALRGTGASGARAVVLNPSGGNPLAFGEGPAANNMAALDRRIMSKMRYTAELMLTSTDEIREALEADEADVLIPALLAIPLHSHKRFLGVLWFGYRQTNSVDLSERNLLHTLAGQAAVLVENAHLFATAEGGRRRLAAVLASTSDAVIVTDPTERVLLINPAMEHIFNLKAGNVANRPVTSVIDVKPLVEALTSSSDYTHNLEVPVEDGRIFYASISRITSREGQVFGRVAVLRDITYLKEIDEMKSDFVSTVSHDLRNPLTFMRGYMTMLPMVGEINDKQQEYVDKILTGIDQMTKMVDDLLDLSRIEAGIDFEQDEIEINPLLSDIADEYWQHAHFAGLKIAVDVSPDVTKVRGDQALIRQAITNLVGNGIKYAPKSGELLLKASRQNSKVIISVHDNGPGIPEDAQIRLFEKFYRVKQPGTERVKGTGLGLAIVKTIAERHGGSARCHSKVGEGSTFFIELPGSSNYLNGSSANGNSV
ncbi:MAG: PAS domain-containing protein, partial [Anaerolineales bacterium]|nr:PAS domain-containing protein [Anaerolineales bacterium]